MWHDGKYEINTSELLQLLWIYLLFEKRINKMRKTETFQQKSQQLLIRIQNESCGRCLSARFYRGFIRQHCAGEAVNIILIVG